jgi:uncharacterized YccA/Bax inhibitor family protein
MDKASNSPSYNAERVFAGVGAIVLSAYSLMVLQTQITEGFDTLGNIFGLGAATAAIICWWVALFYQREESRIRINLTFRGGIIVGGISFLAGFLGPIILTSQANQGPLVGIFITGPVGFVLGIIAGYSYALIKHRGKPHNLEDSPDQKTVR